MSGHKKRGSKQVGEALEKGAKKVADVIDSVRSDKKKLNAETKKAMQEQSDKMKSEEYRKKVRTGITSQDLRKNRLGDEQERYYRSRDLPVVGPRKKAGTQQLEPKMLESMRVFSAKLKGLGYSDSDLARAAQEGSKRISRRELELPAGMSIEEHLFRNIVKQSSDRTLREGRDVSLEEAVTGKMRSEIAEERKAGKVLASGVKPTKDDPVPASERMVEATDTPATKGSFDAKKYERATEVKKKKAEASKRKTPKPTEEEVKNLGKSQADSRARRRATLAKQQTAAEKQTDKLNAEKVEKAVKKAQKQAVDYKLNEEQTKTHIKDAVEDTGVSEEEVSNLISNQTLGKVAVTTLAGAGIVASTTGDEGEPPSKAAVVDDEEEEDLSRYGEGGSEFVGPPTPTIEDLRASMQQSLKDQEGDPSAAKPSDEIETEDDLANAISLWRDELRLASDDYRKEQDKIAKRRKWEKIVEGLAQIAASLYGLHKGLPIGQIDFQSTDWGAEYDRAYRNYQSRKDVAGQEFAMVSMADQRLWERAYKKDMFALNAFNTFETLRQGERRLDIAEYSAEADAWYKKVKATSDAGPDHKAAEIIAGKMYDKLRAGLNSKIGKTERGLIMNQLKEDAVRMRRQRGSYLPDALWPDTTAVSKSDMEKFTRKTYAWEVLVDRRVLALGGNPESVSDRKEAEERLMKASNIGPSVDRLAEQLAEGQ